VHEISASSQLSEQYAGAVLNHVFFERSVESWFNTRQSCIHFDNSAEFPVGCAGVVVVTFVVVVVGCVMVVTFVVVVVAGVLLDVASSQVGIEQPRINATANIANKTKPNFVMKTITNLKFIFLLNDDLVKVKILRNQFFCALCFGFYHAKVCFCNRSMKYLFTC